MTRAREVGDAFVAARRLLVLAGAVAGLWLVSWLTSGSAEAATAQTRGLPDVIGVVVEAVTPAEPRETPDAARPPRRAGETEGRAAAHGARSGAADAGAPGVARAAAGAPVSRGAPVVAGAGPRAARAGSPIVETVAGVASVVAGAVSHGALTSPDSRAAHAKSPTSSPPPSAAKAPASPAPDRAAAVADPPPLVGAAEPVTRAVGAVVAPVGEAAVAPVAQAVGTVLSPVGERAAAVAGSVAGEAQPVAKAAGTSLSPLRAITKPASHLVRGAVPVVRPLTSAARAVLVPVTKPVAALVKPVTDVVARPVAGLLGPLATLVEPVTSNLLGPVLGATSPVVGDLLTPVEDTAGRPVVAPVSDVFRPPHPASPVSSPVRTAAGVTDVRPLAPTAAVPKQQAPAGPHHSARAVHLKTTATAQARGHRPGGTPARPGAPVSPDVATGAGSTTPVAFLASGHAPHHFRASPWTHGVFVPLWRPCEPGTGPG
ncbi:hypothetical protein [Amycolatopsis sp.]|uniref:hypothetical protein n=1 Tax=Amycolatopsis sp. TaxID=37632 RepID=UPI002D7FEA9E|nr:hypothetical protein [Amycolatopsis sp.]HET6711151.1 hypothetical protein [Amycolatopsis sp.]